MNLKKIQEVDFSGKKVLMRVDFNVTVTDGDIEEKFKVEATRKSVEYIRGVQGARLALVSHLGRPDPQLPPKKRDASLSLEQLVDDIQFILGVRPKFVSSCVGREVQKALRAARQGDVLLLENARFEVGEMEGAATFAKNLATPFDVFINNAFSVCHRDQASVTTIAGVLPSAAGFHLQQELKELTEVRENPSHPAVALIGGAKIQTKLPLIRRFEEIYDTVLVGGKIANEAQAARMKFSKKVILPTDFRGGHLDIGPKTVEYFKRYIEDAKTIVWNGPMGKFEEKEFAKGTEDIARAIASSSAYSLVGGGESTQALAQLGLLNDISFVSTGGGAMLAFLSGENMPGLEALKV